MIVLNHEYGQSKSITCKLGHGNALPVQSHCTTAYGEVRSGEEGAAAPKLNATETSDKEISPRIIRRGVGREFNKRPGFTSIARTCDSDALRGSREPSVAVAQSGEQKLAYLDEFKTDKTPQEILSAASTLRQLRASAAAVRVNAAAVRVNAAAAGNIGIISGWAQRWRRWRMPRAGIHGHEEWTKPDLEVQSLDLDTFDALNMSKGARKGCVRRVWSGISSRWKRVKLYNRNIAITCTKSS
ncbi:hypothetical protein B0H19DRAFT_1085467 [Mycena capillaripes]|nr:hypothetical protein B0H19DRAFT_1085467 [Mycena capillaripes]